MTELKAVEEYLSKSIYNYIGVTISDRNVQRLAKGVIEVAFKARVGKSGSRMKETTVEIANLEVGKFLEIEAGCKANLHGQFRTIRRIFMCPDRKWRVENIRHNLWRVERLADGAYNKVKSPSRNPKAVSIASIPIGKSKVFPCEKSWQILCDFTKSKAREFLMNPEAQWRGRRLNKGYEVTRIR